LEAELPQWDTRDKSGDNGGQYGGKHLGFGRQHRQIQYYRYSMSPDGKCGGRILCNTFYSEIEVTTKIATVRWLDHQRGGEGIKESEIDGGKIRC